MATAVLASAHSKYNNVKLICPDRDMPSAVHKLQCYLLDHKPPGGPRLSPACRLARPLEIPTGDKVWSLLREPGIALVHGSWSLYLVLSLINNEGLDHSSLICDVNFAQHTNEGRQRAQIISRACGPRLSIRGVTPCNQMETTLVLTSPKPTQLVANTMYM